MDEARMREMVEAGATLAEIARAFGVDRSTARRWLGQLGLETVRMRRLRTSKAARHAGQREAVMWCPRHGQTRFAARGENASWYRCLRCRSENVSEWRRRAKETLVAESGGGCLACGYDRCLSALHFHHVDPGTKAFALAALGITRSMEEMRAEARKCVLLCANCHAEVEAGMTSVALK
jgi:transposase